MRLGFERTSRRLRALVGDRKGNVLIVAAAGAFVVVGGAGLGTDTVQWYLAKRQLQQAVDSGSLAGAYARHHGSSGFRADVEREVQRNANSVVDIEELNVPPRTGGHVGDDRAVEVVATTSRRLPFSSLFLRSVPVVRARSVATFAAEGEHCILALAPTGVGVNVAGSADVDLRCGVAANSRAANAMLFEGASWLDGSPLTTVGDIRAGASNLPASAEQNPWSLAQIDPIASRNLEVPAFPSTCTATDLVAEPNRTTRLSPGRYCNGMALKGDVELAPGLYIVDGGTFAVEAQARVTGSGVTIILTGQSPGEIAVARIAGGATVSLSPPTPIDDPIWKNLLFYQDPRAVSRTSEIVGGSGIDLSGIIYMPGGNLRFAGNSGYVAQCLFLVSWRITITGESAIRNDCPSRYDEEDFAARQIRVVE